MESQKRTSEPDPREQSEQALAAMAAARESLSHKAVAPLWYHPAVGLLAGGMLIVQAAPPLYQLLYWPVFAAGIWLLIAAYKRRTGLWVSGYRPGRTRLVACATAAVIIVIALVAGWLELERGINHAFLAGGLVIAAIVTVSGLLWESAFRADLRAEGKR